MDILVCIKTHRIIFVSDKAETKQESLMPLFKLASHPLAVPVCPQPQHLCKGQGEPGKVGRKATRRTEGVELCLDD